MKVFCENCKKEFNTIPSRIKIGKGKYCSVICYHISKKGKFTWNKGVKGYKQPKISEARKGKIPSLETIRKMQLSHIGLFAKEKNPMWKGGITPINREIRNSFQYKEWRNQVFIRDNYTCQVCGQRGNIKIHADHIKQFAYYPELRFELSNGRTICKSCHEKTDTYKRKIGQFIYA